MAKNVINNKVKSNDIVKGIGLDKITKDNDLKTDYVNRLSDEIEDLGDAEREALLKNYNNIIGLPPTFNDRADLRTVLNDKGELVQSSGYGVGFYNEFILRSQILSIEVGGLRMDDKDMKNSVKAQVTAKDITDQDTKAMLDIIAGYKGNRLVYFHNYMDKRYTPMVEALEGALAAYMGIDDYAKILDTGRDRFTDHGNKDRLKTLKERKSIVMRLLRFVGLAKDDNMPLPDAVQVYVNGRTNIDFGISHEVSPATLLGDSVKGALDSFGVGAVANIGADQAQRIRELNFLSSDVVSELNIGDDGSFNYSNDKGFFSKFVNSSKGLFKVTVPETWKNVSFTGGTYQFDIILQSASRDDFSAFMHVMSPFAHLLAMSCPITIGGKHGVYAPPFCVRVYSNDGVRINSGMVTDIIIKRNPDFVTANGIPTRLEITLTIKDLYQGFGLTPKPETTEIMSTIGLNDMLGSMTGFNTVIKNDAMIVAIKNRGRKISEFWKNVKKIPGAVLDFSLDIVMSPFTLAKNVATKFIDKDTYNRK